MDLVQLMSVHASTREVGDVIELEKSDRRSNGGVVQRPRSSGTPQSGGVSPRSRSRSCRLCGTELTGRQRDWCSPKCRMAAKRGELNPGEVAKVEKPRTTTKRPSIIGRREPAFSLIPKRTSTRGPQAVELMRSAGVSLDPWQQDVLQAALGRVRGRWAAKVVTVLAGRQNGKSEVGIAAALDLVTSAPKKLVIIAAHEVKTNDELYLRCRDIVETPAFEEFEPKLYSANGQQGIRFNNGSRIRFVARSKHQVRGFSVDLLVLEEAMLLTDIAWSSLMPALSARDGQIWLIGTAPLPTSEVLRRYAIRGRASEDKELAHFEWCAPLDADPDSDSAVAEANPALGRLRKDWIEEEIKGMSSEDYGREVLGWWKEDETPSPFPPGSWDALAFAGHLKVEGTPMFAVDITPTRHHSTIAVAASTDAGRPLVELVDARRGTSWVVPKLQEVLKQYTGTKVIVDRAGWSASLVEDIRAANIDVHETDASEVSTAAGQFLESVLEQKFFHRGDPRLTSAVEGSRQRPIGERWGWDRKSPSVDVSPLVAASLALWGLRVFKPATQYFWWPTTPEERAQQVDPSGWVIAPRAVHPTEIGALFNNG